MARNLLPNDLHMAAKGSGMPIFLSMVFKVKLIQLMPTPSNEYQKQWQKVSRGVQ
jgi:hypothetical protein